MAAFFFYCKPGNISDPVEYTASDQLRRVHAGDELWIVSGQAGHLTLQGHLVVDKVVTRPEAERLLGRSDLWEADQYAIAPTGSAEVTKDIDITDLAGELAFDATVNCLPDNWTLQSLQAMRKLTEASAERLREVWSAGAKTGRNPPWKRDELILALDLYLRLDRTVPDDSNPEVVVLSELLNSLPIHTDRPDEAHFRNPNGVALKLANFRALDQPGHGMNRGGRGDKAVWEEFAGDPARLAVIAALIREGAHAQDMQPPAVLATLEEDEGGFPEGRLLQRMHVVRERNPALRKRKKAAVLRAGGRLACEVCGFDFGVVYGEIGDGFIECHHTVPISTLQPGSETRLADLALVCANCHRMLHRTRRQLSVAGLAGVVAGTRQ